MNVFDKKNISFLYSQLSGLKKMASIPKKLSNNYFKPFISKNPAIKLNLLKIMNAFLRFALKINNNINKIIGTTETIERQDFIHYIIVSFIIILKTLVGI